MMVEWLGRRRGQRAGGLIRDAVDAALTRGVRPYEVGGGGGTGAIAAAMLGQL
jgi:hypothetical protein